MLGRAYEIDYRMEWEEAFRSYASKLDKSDCLQGSERCTEK